MDQSFINFQRWELKIDFGLIGEECGAYFCSSHAWKDVSKNSKIWAICFRFSVWSSTGQCQVDVGTSRVTIQSSVFLTEAKQHALQLQQSDFSHLQAQSHFLSWMLSLKKSVPLKHENESSFWIWLFQVEQINTTLSNTFFFNFSDMKKGWTYLAKLVVDFQSFSFCFSKLQKILLWMELLKICRLESPFFTISQLPKHWKVKKILSLRKNILWNRCFFMFDKNLPKKVFSQRFL